MRSFHILLFLLFVLARPSFAVTQDKPYRTVTISDGISDVYHWKPSFASLEEFIHAVQPPDSKLLASRTTPTHYLAIVQLSDNSIMLFNWEIADKFSCCTWNINAGNGEDVFDKSLKTLILTFNISKKNTSGTLFKTTLTESATYNAFVGDQIWMKPNIPKSLVYTFSAWNEGSGLPCNVYTIPFEWDPSNSTTDSGTK